MDMDDDDNEIEPIGNIVYVPISSNDGFHDEEEHFQLMLDESDEVGDVKNTIGLHETPIAECSLLCIKCIFFSF